MRAGCLSNRGQANRCKAGLLVNKGQANRCKAGLLANKGQANRCKDGILNNRRKKTDGVLPNRGPRNQVRGWGIDQRVRGMVINKWGTIFLTGERLGY